MGILDQIASGGITTIIGQALSIVNKFVKDPEAQAQAQIEILKITQSSQFKEIDAALQEQQMQADINKVEAASDHIFVSGWRPAIGWVCGIGFALQVILFPIVTTVAVIFDHPLEMPTMPTEILMTNLTALLGLGGLRSWEKTKGLRNGGA